MKNMVMDGKIRAKEKASFFLANLGNIPVMTLISSFLLIFYTDVVGLNAVAVGTLFLITKILDGVNDPIMGFLIDRLPRTKLGRFRTYLIIGAIIGSLNFLLLWMGPAFAPASLKLIVAYISYILIGITFDLMDISLNSLLPAMTSNTEERNILSTLKGAAYMVGMIVVSIGAPLAIEGFATKLNGYLVLIIVVTIIIATFSIVGALGIKERIKPIEEKKYSFKNLLSFLIVGPVMITFISQLIFTTGQAIGVTSATYFASYVLGDLAILSITAGVSAGGMILAILLIPKLVRLTSKKIMYCVGLFIYATSTLLRLISVANLTLLCVCQVLAGFGAGMVMILMYGIQADNIDYVEYQKGYRAEGAISSLQAFATKAANALGSAIPAYILAWTGYVANAVQTKTTLDGIVVSTIILPSILGIAGGVLFLFCYKLNDRKMREITATLDAKRERTL